MHTQGKLRQGEPINPKLVARYSTAELWTTGGQRIADCSLGDAGEDREDNARRLFACWNACEGIDTETLEAGHEPVTADYLREICHEYGKLTNGEDDPDWGWFVNGDKYGPYLKMDRKRCEVWTSIHTFLCHVDDRQQLAHLLLGMKVKTAARGEVTA